MFTIVGSAGIPEDLDRAIEEVIAKVRNSGEVDPFAKVGSSTGITASLDRAIEEAVARVNNATEADPVKVVGPAEVNENLPTAVIGNDWTVVKRKTKNSNTKKTPIANEMALPR